MFLSGRHPDCVDPVRPVCLYSKLRRYKVSKRCSHNNCNIHEYFTEDVSHLFVDGTYDSSEHSAGEQQDLIQVECYDCGKVMYFNIKKLPRWLKNKLDIALYGE